LLTDTDLSEFKKRDVSVIEKIVNINLEKIYKELELLSEKRDRRFEDEGKGKGEEGEEDEEKTQKRRKKN
jgi:hypothetical protein